MQVVFGDLTDAKFPFVIESFDATGKVVGRRYVPTRLHLISSPPEFGMAGGLRFSYATGEVEEYAA